MVLTVTLPWGAARVDGRVLGPTGVSVQHHTGAPSTHRPRGSTLAPSPSGRCWRWTPSVEDIYSIL